MVVIEFEPFDELTDNDHPMGVTDEGYEEIVNLLSEIGNVSNVRRR